MSYQSRFTPRYPYPTPHATPEYEQVHYDLDRKLWARSLREVDLRSLYAEALRYSKNPELMPEDLRDAWEEFKRREEAGELKMGVTESNPSAKNNRSGNRSRNKSRRTRD